MALRSVTGLPDNPDDYDTVCGNGRERRHSKPAHPCGRELTAAEMTAELHRILGPTLDRIRNIEQSAHRCPHGIDLERAACGRCTPIGATP